MKKKNLIFLALTGLIGLALLFTACNKENDNQLADTETSENDAFAESVFDNVSNIADEAYNLGSNNYKSTEGDRIILSPCATVSIDTTIFPYELIIDFGDTNCLCLDGRYRRGEIIITFNGRYRYAGTVITHGFNDYYVNDHRIEGSKVVTNMGLNENNNMYYTIEVIGLIYLADNGGTISWNASKVREWVEGRNTWNLWDDVYHITGSAYGIKPSGASWEREIINPLRKELVCRFIVSGTVEVRPQDRPVRVLDYGNGDCDNIATVLINGVTYTIRLR